MRDVLAEVGAWFDAGRPFALATVVRTWGSSPRQPGASMAVSDDGEVVGSVSGGCVEGAVHEVAQEVLTTGRPRLETYGVSDDDAFAVGLTCGGTLQVLVERVDADSFPELAAVREAVTARRAIALVTTLDGAGERARHLVLDDVNDANDVADAAAVGGAVAVFVEVMEPPPVMYVFGAIDLAAALARAATLLGHHVVVCDARPLFATPARFPGADEVVVDHPQRYLRAARLDERSVVCVLTHDPEVDAPLLALALRSPARYVGAMGSRATHAARLERLRELGVDEHDLTRLRSPIGLDLGARTPEETAVSILAEVVAAAGGGSGRPLREVGGAIHH